MMMFKVFMVIAISFLSWPILADEPVTSAAELMWRDAVGLYSMESHDYLETLDETFNEFNSVRQKNMKEKYDTRLFQIESVLSTSNLDFLKQIDSYVNSNGIDSLDDSLMMRMAQLHYDRAGFDLALKMRSYEQTLHQYQNKQIKFIPELPSADFSRVIYYAAELLRTFQNSPLSDKAHYILGYCLFDANKNEKAAKIYERLIRLHPYSLYAPEARWRLAEHYFDNGLKKEALLQYQILSEGKNSFSQKALYKLGAIAYSNREYENAFNIFLRLYERVENLEGNGDPEVATLKDESLDYLAILKTKLIKLELKEATDILVTRKLAQAYRRAQDENGYRKTYLDFIQKRNISKVSPEFMNNIIESFESEGFSEKAQAVRNQFIQGLNGSSQFWILYKDDVATITTTQDLYEEHLLSSAKYYAERAKETKRKTDYATAILYYKKFIQEYPYSPYLSRAKFETGELQYFSGAYLDAANTYMTVALEPQNNQYRDEACYGFLLSEAKRVGFPLKENQALSPRRKKSDELEKTSELTSKESAFVQAADFFETTISRADSRRHAVKLRVAEVYYRHNNFQRVQTLLEPFLKDSVVTDITPKALRLLMSSYDIVGNWPKVIETRNKLKNLNAGYDTSSANGRVERVHLEKLSKAWSLEQQNRDHEAALEYEQHGILYPKSQETPHALYRAAVLHRKMGDYKASDRNISRLKRDYPRSDYNVEAEFLSAANFESLVNFDEASKLYERFISKHPKNNLTLLASPNAARLRGEMGDLGKEALDYLEYARRVNEHEAWLQSAKYFYNAGKNSQGDKILEPYFRSKVGHDYQLRAYYQRASLVKSSEVSDCKKVSEIFDRYKETLGAQSKYSYIGCRYLEIRNDYVQLINSKKTKSAYYDKILSNLLKKSNFIFESDIIEWKAKMLYETGRLYEFLFEKFRDTDLETSRRYLAQSLSFYTQLSELKDPLMPRGIFYSAKQSIARLNSKKTFSMPELYWQPTTIPLIGNDIFEIKWPSDDLQLKSYIDSSDYEKALKLSEQMIKEEPAGYKYQALALANFSIRNFKESIGSLRECLERIKDPYCSTTIMLLSNYDADLKSAHDIVHGYYKNSSGANFKMAMASYSFRQRKFDEAIKLLQQSIFDDSQKPTAYILLAHIYMLKNKNELALRTLDMGARNTQGDENILLTQGYFSLLQDKKEKIDAINSDFEGRVSLSALATTYLLFSKNEIFQQNDIPKFLARLEESSNIDSINGLFAFSLFKGEQQKAIEIWKKIELSSAIHPYSGFLSALYWDAIFEDKQKAQNFYDISIQLGGWTGFNKNRKPAKEEP